MKTLPDRFQIKDLYVDLGQQRVRRGDTQIPLPKLSFDLLLALARASPDLVSIDDLMTRVWPGLVVNPETVGQRIKLLRDALGDDPRAPQYIESLRARGYRLLPDVLPVEPVAAAPLKPVPEPVPASPPEADAEQVVTEQLQHVKAGADVPAATVVSTASVRRRAPLVSIVSALVLIGACLGVWSYVKKRPAAAVPKSEVTLTGAPMRTVAVMPFDDLSLSHDNGQLALALPEMVLQRLGMVKELIVIARSSSFAFAGQQVDAREIGRRLDARYLVEGALQRAGDRLRVTAQLIDAQSGRQLQALRFDQNLKDIFELQDDIAAQLAAALQVQLLGADTKRVDRSASTSLDAYLSYLNSQTLLNRWIVKDVEQAIAELEHAIKLDPKFALAYAELARARRTDYFLRLGNSNNPEARELLELANKALQLDPQLGEAYAIRAGVELDLGMDKAAVDADFRRGIELAPNYGPAYEMYAEALDDMNRGEDGRAMIEHAVLIDPIAPRNVYYKGLYLQGVNMELAERAFMHALELGADFPPSYARLALLRAAEGKVAVAVKLIERALRVETQSVFINSVACSTYLQIGDRQAAGSVAVGGAPDSDIAIMLAVYDRKYGAVRNNRTEDSFTLNTPSYANFVAWLHNIVEDGNIDASIARLRSQLAFKGDGDGLSFSDSSDLNPPMALAYLLRLRGERVASGNIVAALRQGTNPGNPPHLFAEYDMLAGDNDAALKKYATEIGQGHWNLFWVWQRDPVMDPITADPRYKALIEVQDARMAQQRKLVEEMRVSGDVPRR